MKPVAIRQSPAPFLRRKDSVFTPLPTVIDNFLWKLLQFFTIEEKEEEKIDAFFHICIAPSLIRVLILRNPARSNEAAFFTSFIIQPGWNICAFCELFSELVNLINSIISDRLK